MQTQLTSFAPSEITALTGLAELLGMVQFAFVVLYSEISLVWEYHLLDTENFSNFQLRAADWTQTFTSGSSPKCTDMIVK